MLQSRHLNNVSFLDTMHVMPTFQRAKLRTYNFSKVFIKPMIEPRNILSIIGYVPHKSLHLSNPSKKMQL